MPTGIEAIDPQVRERFRRLRLVAFVFDGVFTDNGVWVSQDGIESVRCDRSDGLGLQKLLRLGVATVVISTEANPVVSARCRKLNIRCVQVCRDKRAELAGIAAALGVSLDDTAFVGNDINDLECLASVGLPIVVADAHEDVVESALYRTTRRGGHGAVREVCDLIVEAQA